MLQKDSPEPFGYAQESRAEGLRINEIELDYKCY